MGGQPASDVAAPNAYRLLWAGFLAILAAGVGFGIRGGILANWGSEYGFTGEELGRIAGGGFTGFCFGIIIGGVIADKVGYGKLVISAFLLHIVSAIVTFIPAWYTITAPDGTVTVDMAKETVYSYLFWGSFLFAAANGNLEAVANPLVATLFPGKRTHYLNILHASWPAGLVLGGAAGWVLGEQYNMRWERQLGLYLLPVLLYGLLFLGQKMPKSEASKRGLSLGEMFKDVGILGGLVVCFLLSMFFSSVVTPLVTPKDPTDPKALAAVQKKLELAREELGDKDQIDSKAVLAKLTDEEKEVYDSHKKHSERAQTVGNTCNYIGYAVGAALLIVVAIITNFSLGSFLLFVLFIAHALVGAVELGTDNWIQNITGNILTTGEGKILFVFTSMLMFLLRFCADFIEKKIGLSPVGILVVCAVLACGGLLLTSQITTFMVALLAGAVYGVGKTFFWPTMLAVASDRFPRTGAVAISIMGGIGMMSAGLIGAPGLGFAKDRFSGEALKENKPALFSEYKADKVSKFLGLEAQGLDGKKLGAVQEALKSVQKELEKEGVTDPQKALDKLTADQRAVYEASVAGDRKTLIADAAIPATMAVIYLMILIYFAAIGGYKPIHLADEAPPSVIEAAKHAGEG
jgi:MFS family permease